MAQPLSAFSSSRKGTAEFQPVLKWVALPTSKMKWAAGQAPLHDTNERDQGATYSSIASNCPDLLLLDLASEHAHEEIETHPSPETRRNGRQRQRYRVARARHCGASTIWTRR
jgi:hypothetical protein